MLAKYIFKSGIDKENTRYTAEGKWWDMQWVRFRSGSPEKMGGWTKATLSAFTGVCRKLFNWIDLDNDNIMAIGTNTNLWGERGGAVFEITPVLDSDTATGNVITTQGSKLVRINFTGSNTVIGQQVEISGVVGTAGLLGGIPVAEINGVHEVALAPSENYFFIQVTSSSTVDTTCADSVTINLLLPPGPEYAIQGAGWGAGPWEAVSLLTASTTTSAFLSNTATTVSVSTTSGFSATGQIIIDSEVITYSGITSTSFTGCTRAVTQTAPTAASTPQHRSGSFVQQCIVNVSTRGWGDASNTSAPSNNNIRLWSFDNFGEDLLANPRGGQIFYWKPSLGYDSTNRAIPLSDLSGANSTPLFSNTVLATDQRHVLAFGTNAIGETTQDPLLIRWSDQEDAADWYPTATNSAGDLRVPMGSLIVGIQSTRQETLVFTDESLHSLQYIGAPYIFSLQTLADNVNLIGPNAVITVNNVTYWMGEDKFYAYSGRVETLPCSLRRFVYSDINFEQSYQIHVGLNEQFGEIIWFYCSANSVVIDRYVVYNYLENIWYYGQRSRTAWLDSHVRSAPFATAYDGFMYEHEVGCDDGSTNPPTAISAYIESADFDIDDGDKFSFIKRVIPDITFQNSTSHTPSALYTIKARNFPGSSFDQSNDRIVERTATAAVDNYTNQVWIRIRGRQAVIRVESTDVGVMWQVGSTRLDIRPDGRR